MLVLSLSWQRIASHTEAIGTQVKTKRLRYVSFRKRTGSRCLCCDRRDDEIRSERVLQRLFSGACSVVFAVSRKTERDQQYLIVLSGECPAVFDMNIFSIKNGSKKAFSSDLAVEVQHQLQRALLVHPGLEGLRRGEQRGVPVVAAVAWWKRQFF